MSRTLIIVSGLLYSGKTYCVRNIIVKYLRDFNKDAYIRWTSEDFIKISLDYIKLNIFDEKDFDSVEYEDELFKEFIEAIIYPASDYDNKRDEYVIAELADVSRYYRKRLYDSVKEHFDYCSIVSVETPIEACLDRAECCSDRFKVSESIIRDTFENYEPVRYDTELFKVDNIFCYNGVTGEMRELDK